MQRAIVGFHQDDEDDWVADLSCGHGQHVRHRPPFTLRPWVTTAEGRASRLGERLDCVRCDRLELPPGFVAYHRSPVFTEGSIPRELRSAHTTKAGTWATLEVLGGALVYVIAGDPERRTTLRAGEHVRIAPEVEHRIEPIGAVSFTVEFYRAPAHPAPAAGDSAS